MCVCVYAVYQNIQSVKGNMFMDTCLYIYVSCVRFCLVKQWLACYQQDQMNVFRLVPRN